MSRQAPPFNKTIAVFACFMMLTLNFTPLYASGGSGSGGRGKGPSTGSSATGSGGGGASNRKLGFCALTPKVWGHFGTRLLPFSCLK
jgi:hypothetical protein